MTDPYVCHINGVTFTINKNPSFVRIYIYIPYIHGSYMGYWKTLKSLKSVAFLAFLMGEISPQSLPGPRPCRVPSAIPKARAALWPLPLNERSPFDSWRNHRPKLRENQREIMGENPWEIPDKNGGFDIRTRTKILGETAEPISRPDTDSDSLTHCWVVQTQSG